MNLCKPTNNLHSNIMHASKQPVPEAGMGITILHWTDRLVGTIVEVISPDCFTYREDTTTADGDVQKLGMGHQSWKHTPRTEGPVGYCMRAKDGKWYIAHLTKTGKRSVNQKCTPILIGHREYFYHWEF